MKTVVLCISGLILCLFTFGQSIIQSDTAITQTIRVNQSFELQFLDSPGAGYMWELTEGSDTTSVSISLIKQVLAEGYRPNGGKYISVYKFTGLVKRTFLFDYFYGRPWSKEKLYKCLIMVKVI